MDESAIKSFVLNAHTIAVLGMQDERKADRAAYRIPAIVQSHGYKVLPVNPRITESLGERAYPTLADLPIVPDILNVFRASDAIPEIVDDILALPVERRPKMVWLQLGITHEAAEARLKEAGIFVVADRCLGVELALWRANAPG